MYFYNPFAFHRNLFAIQFIKMCLETIIFPSTIQIANGIKRIACETVNRLNSLESVTKC